MTSAPRRTVTFLLAAVLSVPMGLSEAAAAQDPETAPGLEPAPTRGGRGARRGAAGRADIMTVQQVEEYFDQVMLHQARANLSLTPDQFLRFGAGLRRLQMARRQQQRRRVALVRELNALTSRSPIDEASVSAKLEELDRAAGEASDDTRAAYAAIDRVLDLRQRARFRVFEEMMERRKLDLVARARQQAARAGAPEP